MTVLGPYFVIFQLAYPIFIVYIVTGTQGVEQRSHEIITSAEQS